MKNRKFWLGMLVMALVFGMMFVGCDSDSDSDSGSDVLKGTWYETENGLKSEELVASGGKWTMYLYSTPGGTDKVAMAKGTYTKGTTVPGVNTTTVSLRITHINTGFMSGSSTEKWEAWDDVEGAADFMGSQTQAGTVTGNTLSITGENGGTFTKQQ